MGLPLPKQKNWKLSAKLKARCQFLGINPIPETNQARKEAIRAVTGPVGAWPTYLETLGGEKKAEYKQLLHTIEGSYGVPLSDLEREKLLARHTARREAQKEKQKKKAEAYELRKKKRNLISEKAQAANREAAAKRAVAEAAKKAKMKERRDDRIARMEYKISRLKGTRTKAA